MTYTNGFDIDTVLPALKGRLGWRQPTLAGSPVLDSENLGSISKRYFQSFHASCTLDNIKAAQEDPAITDNDFNQLLADLQTDAIMRSLNEIFRETELIEQCLMYTRFATIDQSIDNSGLMVGYIINVANDFGLSTQINSATFYFDQDVTFNMYLYMDGVKTPLKTISVSVVAWERTVVEFDQLVLNFKTGQKYYFCYNQDELGAARAIREQVETWATTRCFEAYTFKAPVDDVFGFNHNYRQYDSLPQGVNMEVITFRDHTQKILRKANLFDEVQGLTMAAMVAEQISFSTRSNFTERQTKQNAGNLYMDLNQAYPTKEVPVTPGLKSRLAGEYKKLKSTFFPPQQPISVSQRTNAYDIDGDTRWNEQNIKILSNPPIGITTS